jgi:DNA-binding NarL/FixJ family response regulator
MERRRMKIRMVLAVKDQECANLVSSMLDEALQLVPLEVEVVRAHSRASLLERTRDRLDDVVFLDWDLVGAGTPDLVREMARQNPRIRVVALLPLQLRQYRQTLWEAGACSSVPKEHMDQEWLSSVLCLMNRAMSREASLYTECGVGGPLPIPQTSDLRELEHV